MHWQVYASTSEHRPSVASAPTCAALNLNACLLCCRLSRPFARTPVSMQPLSLGLPPSRHALEADGAGAMTPAGSSSSQPAHAQQPAALPWTPMRAAQATQRMQPRAPGSSLRLGAGTSLSAGLKRARSPEGSPSTPLAGAGLAGDTERRIRQRGDQVLTCCQNQALLNFAKQSAPCFLGY